MRPTNASRHRHSPPGLAPARCEADILEGLERFAEDELRTHFGDLVRFRPSSRPDALSFEFGGDLDALLDLRSAVAVSLVRRFDVPRPKALLGHQHFEALVQLVEQALQLWRPGTFTTLRLGAAGEDSAVLTRLKEDLGRRVGLTPEPDEGDLLLRLRRAPEGWEALVRLSPRPLATRPWRVCNMPGALNATLAHAMARLTGPRPEDRVLNLACGSGTLLIERLALAPARSALGCDTDAAALRCARQNFDAAEGHELPPAARPRLEPWDASALPLADASVDVIVADLPFGQLIGSHRENEALYPRIMAEAARVAAPGARMALLTHEVRLLERVAQSHADAWRLVEVVRVRSGGMTPRVFLFHRLGRR